MRLNRKSRFVVQRLRLELRRLKRQACYHRNRIASHKASLARKDFWPAAFIPMFEKQLQANTEALQKCRFDALAIERRLDPKLDRLVRQVFEEELATEELADMERLRNAP